VCVSASAPAIASEDRKVTAESRRPIAVNLGWLTGGTFVARLAQFALTIYLARTLGSEGFGKLAYVQAFFWYMLIVVDAGLGTIGCREVARDRQRMGPLFAAITIVRTLAFALAALLAAVLLTFATSQRELYWLFMLYTASLLAYSLVPDWLFRGLERMEFAAIWEAAPKLLLLASALVLVHSRADLLKVGALKFCSDIAVCALLLAVAMAGPLRRTRPSRAAVLTDGPNLLAQSLPVAAAALLTQIYYGFDIIVLRAFHGDSVAGQYAAAYRIVAMLMTGLYLLSAVYQPALSRLFTEPARFRRTVKQFTLISVFASVLPATVIAMLAGQILSLLFGAEYAGIALALTVLMAAIPIAYLNSALGTVLIAAGQQSKMLVGTAAGAATNLLLNLALIPRFEAMGAAVATVLSYGTAWAVLKTVARKTLP